MQTFMLGKYSEISREFLPPKDFGASVLLQLWADARHEDQVRLRRTSNANPVAAITAAGTGSWLMERET